jgi:hypothetical protein
MIAMNTQNPFSYMPEELRPESGLMSDSPALVEYGLKLLKSKELLTTPQLIEPVAKDTKSLLSANGDDPRPAFVDSLAQDALHKAISRQINFLREAKTLTPRDMMQARQTVALCEDSLQALSGNKIVPWHRTSYMLDHVAHFVIPYFLQSSAERHSFDHYCIDATKALIKDFESSPTLIGKEATQRKTVLHKLMMTVQLDTRLQERLVKALFPLIEEREAAISVDEIPAILKDHQKRKIRLKVDFDMADFDEKHTILGQAKRDLRHVRNIGGDRLRKSFDRNIDESSFWTR